MRECGIELGGIEYITDDRDGQRLYYDINALSNFVADGQRVIGFDPFVRLVDWLEAEAAATVQAEPVLAGCSLMRYGFWLPVFGGWLRNVEKRTDGSDVGLCPPRRHARRRPGLLAQPYRRAESQ